MGKFIKTGNDVKKSCQYCDHITTACALPRHEAYCYLNPENMVSCPVCKEPIKNYKKNKTCSTSCANTYFRTGKDNPNWKTFPEDCSNIELPPSSYKKICFTHHKKECVICGESNIVEVHHYDHNHKNNQPYNLIPLCPTHHRYLHSRYKYLIKNQVDNYYQYITSVPSTEPGLFRPKFKPFNSFLTSRSSPVLLQ